MLPAEPRSAIHAIPFLVDAEPRNAILIAGFDADGTCVARHAYDIPQHRPLDPPILDSSLWGNDVTHTSVVAFSDRPTLPMEPLLDAWRHQGRTPVHAIWAGEARWRSLLCDSACCTPRGNRYGVRLAGHDDYRPAGDTDARDRTWRRATWDTWMRAIEAPMRCDIETMLELSGSLHDIPVRDAILAHSALEGGAYRAGITQVLHQLCTRSRIGVAAPTFTALAAMHYLDDDLDAAAEATYAVLAVDEYSLARLLANGIEMRAPASLLARSFAHWHPLDLLAADAA